MKKLFVLTVCLAVFVSGEIRNSLNSNEFPGTWTVWNGNKSIEVEAKVPGGIYTDLQSAGLLTQGDIFYRFNDINYRWVSKENWTYQTKFSLPSETLSKAVVNLVFHGLDTVADIFLNGKHLTSVSNMFIRYVLPVKGLVNDNNNILEIRFKSPIHEAQRLATIQHQSYTVPPECTPQSYNGECHVNFLRKMQASFSWDWGPAFPSVGIWKPIEIEAFDLGVIRDVVVSPIKFNETSWMVDTVCHIEYSQVNHLPHVVTGWLSLNNKDISISTTFSEGKIRDESTRNGYMYQAQFFLNNEQVHLWWPNGLGDATLYDLTIKMETTDGLELSQKSVKIGLRVIELVQDEIKPDKPGLSFYFKVNGVPIFAKGSNWIPAHILPEKGYDEFEVIHALHSAKEANMNMLRVWGGGVYESDTFYSIADELGILIWQDMMFACSMYPATDDFLDNVKTEVKQQVRRLQHHPSIAIWAGNNENEAALRGNWYGTARNLSVYKEDYIKLYVDTIQSVVLLNDISREYVTSSPSNGIETANEGYLAQDPYSPLYGDVHYYNYILDGWNDYVYPDTRFASEYGFQSMPSFHAMSSVTLREDRNLQSEFTKKRQHLPGGNDYLRDLIGYQLKLPEDDGSDEFYKIFIYYSQIIQAMSTKTETEKYRRDRNKLTDDNKGQTMGAMYWQLNDVWPAPSWSSIEFGGRWKMLQYFAKKFFSAVLVSPERTPDGLLNVFLISDLLQDVKSVRLNVGVYSWDNFTPKKVYTSVVRLKASSAEIHATKRLQDILEDANCTKFTCFLYFTAKGKSVYSDNFLFPSKLHEVTNLRKANLTVNVKPTNNPSKIIVEVTTDQVAPFVWLETEEVGEFSDNGFLQLQPKVEVTFGTKDITPVDIEKIKSTLTVFDNSDGLGLNE
ncbi:hypothetical protein RUM43_008141 [Polyplax serrata]|uniref:beta-mannosidase n=1 Tax=Polyplax serrata TaxID=468196 RepID=A0AAN8PEB4_POLSC